MCKIYSVLNVNMKAMRYAVQIKGAVVEVSFCSSLVFLCNIICDLVQKKDAELSLQPFSYWIPVNRNFGKQ